MKIGNLIPNVLRPKEKNLSLADVITRNAGHAKLPDKIESIFNKRYGIPTKAGAAHPQYAVSDFNAKRTHSPLTDAVREVEDAAGRLKFTTMDDTLRTAVADRFVLLTNRLQGAHDCWRAALASAIKEGRETDAETARIRLDGQLNDNDDRGPVHETAATGPKHGPIDVTTMSLREAVERKLHNDTVSGTTLKKISEIVMARYRLPYLPRGDKTYQWTEFNVWTAGTLSLATAQKDIRDMLHAVDDSAMGQDGKRALRNHLCSLEVAVRNAQTCWSVFFWDCERVGNPMGREQAIAYLGGDPSQPTDTGTLLAGNAAVGSRDSAYDNDSIASSGTEDGNGERFDVDPDADWEMNSDPGSDSGSVSDTAFITYLQERLAEVDVLPPPLEPFSDSDSLYSSTDDEDEPPIVNPALPPAPVAQEKERMPRVLQTALALISRY